MNRATKQSLSEVLAFDWAGFSFTARLPRPDKSGLAMTPEVLSEVISTQSVTSLSELAYTLKHLIAL
jgi:hypothetical protein